MASAIETVIAHIPFVPHSIVERYQTAEGELRAFDRGERVLTGRDLERILHDLDEGHLFESIIHPKRPLRHALSTLTGGALEVAKYAAVVGGTVALIKTLGS